jgi:hypothetical protein
VVLPRLNHGEKQVLFSPYIFLSSFNAMLEGIYIVEFLWSLDKRDLLILKVTDDFINEMRQRRVVGIKNCYEFCFRLFKSEIEIACLACSGKSSRGECN